MQRLQLLTQYVVRWSKAVGRRWEGKFGWKLVMVWWEAVEVE